MVAKRICPILIILLFQSPWCYSDLFSGAEGVAKLIPTQEWAIESLETVLGELATLRSSLAHTLSSFKQHDVKANEDPYAYIGNPINSFTLIRRLVIDYEQIGADINHTGKKIKQFFVKNDILSYPTDEDFEGAVTGMVRLIDTYRLDHRNISEGRIYHEQGLPMTQSDIFEFAEELLKKHDSEYAAIWLEEAVRKFDEHSTYKLSDVYLKLADCHLNMGNLNQSLHWYDVLLDAVPSHPVAAEKRRQLLQLVAKNENKWELMPYESMVKHTESFDYFENVTFEAMCREEYLPDAETYHKLKCFYKHGKHPFLKIAPFKVEEGHPNISLYVFHDVISDAEIEWIKEISRPLLARSHVIDHKTGEGMPTDHRTAQTCRIKTYDYDISARIYRRAHHMTDLDTSSSAAENFQIANYGIGGHYTPHMDFTGVGNKYYAPPEIERTATVLFYLSDVVGGGTSFNQLGVTIMPKKGNAAFWMNTHPSGEGNLVTRHSACPVISGSKWVGNIWISQGGQMHTAPCNLEYQVQGNFTYKNLKPPMRREQVFG